MRHRLLTLALSAALSLPHLAAPAMADQRDYTHRHGANGELHLAPGRDSPSVTGSGAGTGIAVLTGLALAAVLAKQAQERREAEARSRDQIRNHDRDRNRDWNRDRNHDLGRDRDRNQDRHRDWGQRGDRLRVIPANCFVQGDGPRGPWRGFGARCVERNVARPRLLPDECLSRVATYRGSRHVYNGRCLSRRGWTTDQQARRH